MAAQRALLSLTLLALAAVACSATTITRRQPTTESGSSGGRKLLQDPIALLSSFRGVTPLVGQDAAVNNVLDLVYKVLNGVTNTVDGVVGDVTGSGGSGSAGTGDAGTAGNAGLLGGGLLGGGGGGGSVQKPPPGNSGNGIDYHSPNPVMHGTVPTYLIYYGNWDPSSVGPNAQTIIETFMGGIGSTNYYKVNDLYWDTTNYVQSVQFAQSVSVGNTMGSSLNGQDIANIVEAAISSGQLPRNPNALYFVLTSPDIDQTDGFCTSFCGYHTYYTDYLANHIKFAFIGNPDRCYTSCSASPTGTVTPNGNKGIDGMISIIAHEQEEATSDPDLNAWYDSNGEENADKCAYNYGTTQTAVTANGAAAYNIVVSGKNYLIQQNWLNANGGHCAMSQ